MRAQWHREKEIIDQIRKLQPEIEELRTEEEPPQRQGDLGKAAEITYGKIPEAGEEARGAPRKSWRRCRRSTSYLREEVTDQDIAAIVSKWTGHPRRQDAAGRDGRSSSTWRRTLRSASSGRSEAVDAVSNAVRRSRAGLGDETRPIGSFLFLGPTGVGKTELARALAEFLFDDEIQRLRRR